MEIIKKTITYKNVTLGEYEALSRAVNEPTSDGFLISEIRDEIKPAGRVVEVTYVKQYENTF